MHIKTIIPTFDRYIGHEGMVSTHNVNNGIKEHKLVPHRSTKFLKPKVDGS